MFTVTFLKEDRYVLGCINRRMNDIWLYFHTVKYSIAVKMNDLDIQQHGWHSKSQYWSTIFYIYSFLLYIFEIQNKHMIEKNLKSLGICSRTFQCKDKKISSRIPAIYCICIGFCIGIWIPHVPIIFYVSKKLMKNSFVSFSYYLLSLFLDINSLSTMLGCSLVIFLSYVPQYWCYRQGQHIWFKSPV